MSVPPSKLGILNVYGVVVSSLGLGSIISTTSSLPIMGFPFMFLNLNSTSLISYTQDCTPPMPTDRVFFFSNLEKSILLVDASQGDIVVVSAPISIRKSIGIIAFSNFGLSVS